MPRTSTFTTCQTAPPRTFFTLLGWLLLAGTASAQAPVVTAVSPPRNTIAAPRTTPVAVTFNQPLSNTTATQQALKVFGEQSGLETGTAAASGNTLTFAPSKGFKSGETVVATVTRAAQSTTGTAVTPYVFQFTAGTAPTAGTFGGGSDLSVGNNPVAIATGDVDGDGDLDLAVASGYSIVNVRLNNGSGTYSGGQEVSVGLIPRDLTLGDIDNDGDLDLLVDDDQNSKISVRLNNGSGTFSGTQEVAVGNGPQSQTVGDIDGDGDLDLVTANLRGTASVRLNNGSGSFSGDQEVIVGGTLLRVALHDVDSDGDLDLLAVNTGGVAVCLNNGVGTFTTTSNTPANGFGYSLAVGDIDGDGDLDLLIGNFYNYGSANNTVSVRLNNGTGVFNGSQEVIIGPYTTGANVAQVKLGDVDGDGDLDLVAANTTNDAGRVSIRLNDGNGTFSGVQEVAVLLPSGLAVGDVDGDGDLDLLTSSNARSGASIRLNQGAAAPTITGISPAISPVGSTVVITGTNFLNTTSITFNGVAATSFVLNSATQLTVTVPSGATSGAVVVTTNVGVSNGIPFTVGPLLTITSFSPARNATNAPRNTPVALTFNRELSTGAATQGAVKVFGTQAGGPKAGTASVSGNTLTFTPTVSFKPGETVFSTVTTAVTSSSQQPFLAPYVFQFTAATAPAAGIFTGPLEASVGTNPQSVALGDVDGDGDVDVLTANNLNNAPTNSTVSIRLNNGNGAYTGTQEVGVGTGPYSIKLGDIDGDGDLDFVTANANSGERNTISVRLNNGSGTFSGTQTLSVGNLPHDVALGDVDGDGDLDLLVANYVTFGPNYATNSTVSVRLNNGSGTFATTGQDVIVGPRPLHLVVGDIDNDGDLDFITANSSGTTASVRLNDGQGTFGGTQEVAVGFNPHDVVLGDVDSDGDLDLLTANYYDYTNPANNFTNSTVSVRLNNGRGLFSGTQQVSVGQGAITLALGDADGDGDLDLFATNNLTNSLGVRLNNGAGVFSGAQQVAVGMNPTGITLGDVDGNGTLDVLVANYNSNSVSVRLNPPSSAKVLAASPALRAEQLGLYPNPAHTFVRLQLPGGFTGQVVRVLNTRGQVVLQQQLSAATTTPELAMPSLASGLYMVQVQTSQGTLASRLVVE
ncbi:FG-GAP-like repeat-containing protein [Hymenobacter sp. GOD-10R]|uniref:FG-GAP-like repeat-containing protein n=1 Tax=Hymenobacter sp. GOD-10R TaxID=3093922 RepID=UPI002D775113|nr:FG-GAP-like repeat-containing protein [Hymenobacter sp. GOD-10R]WRQ31776.1 FG-GAP-like repeat-containing protein [Hymenobacter sp. GOD-10R]